MMLPQPQDYNASSDAAPRAMGIRIGHQNGASCTKGFPRQWALKQDDHWQLLNIVVDELVETALNIFVRSRGQHAYNKTASQVFGQSRPAPLPFFPDSDTILNSSRPNWTA